MSAKFSQYDMVRIELFEMLFPKMIYSGTVEEQDRFFYALKEDGMNLVHDMYESMCEQDKIQYPYEKNDFSVKTLDRGGVGMIQINIPEQNEQMNGVWIPARVEMADDWYLVGLPGLKLDGLEVRCK